MQFTRWFFFIFRLKKSTALVHLQQPPPLSRAVFRARAHHIYSLCRRIARDRANGRSDFARLRGEAAPPVGAVDVGQYLKSNLRNAGARYSRYSTLSPAGVFCLSRQSVLARVTAGQQGSAAE